MNRRDAITIEASSVTLELDINARNGFATLVGVSIRVPADWRPRIRHGQLDITELLAMPEHEHLRMQIDDAVAEYEPSEAIGG